MPAGVMAAVQALGRIGNKLENDRTNIWGDEKISATTGRNAKKYDPPAGYSYQPKERSSAQVVGNTSSNLGKAVTNNQTNIWANKTEEPKPNAEPSAKKGATAAEVLDGKASQPQGLVASWWGKTKTFFGGQPAPNEPRSTPTNQQYGNSGAQTSVSATPRQDQPSNYQSVGTGKQSAYGEIATMAPRDEPAATTTNNSLLGTFFGFTSTGFGSGKK